MKEGGSHLRGREIGRQKKWGGVRRKVGGSHRKGDGPFEKLKEEKETVRVKGKRSQSQERKRQA